MSHENGPSKIRCLVFLPQSKARHRDKTQQIGRQLAAMSRMFDRA
jgi:hypothetical protein